mgnify:CR=1 FL=1
MSKAWDRGDDDDPIVSDEIHNEERSAAIRSWFGNLARTELSVVFLVFALYIWLSRSNGTEGNQYREGLLELYALALTLAGRGDGPDRIDPMTVLGVLATIGVAVTVAMASAHSRLERANGRVRARSRGSVGIRDLMGREDRLRREEVFDAQFAVMGAFGVATSMLPILTTVHLLVLGAIANAVNSEDSGAAYYGVVSLLGALILGFLLAECARLFSAARSPVVVMRRGDARRLASRLIDLYRKQPIPTRRIAVRGAAQYLLLAAWLMVACRAGTAAGTAVMVLGLVLILALAVCFQQSSATAVMELGFFRWANVLGSLLMLILGSIVLVATVLIATGSLNNDHLSSAYVLSVVTVWLLLMILLALDLLGRAGMGPLSVLGLRRVALAALGRGGAAPEEKHMWTRLMLLIGVEIIVAAPRAIVVYGDPWDRTIFLWSVLVLLGSATVGSAMMGGAHARRCHELPLRQILGRTRARYAITTAGLVILASATALLIPGPMGVRGLGVGVYSVLWVLVHMVIILVVLGCDGDLRDAESARVGGGDPAGGDASSSPHVVRAARWIARQYGALGDQILDWQVHRKRRWLGSVLSDDVAPWNGAMVRLWIHGTLREAAMDTQMPLSGHLQQVDRRTPVSTSGSFTPAAR